MTAAVFPEESEFTSALGAFGRAIVSVLAGVLVFLAVALAAVAATAIGLLIAFAALAFRLMPRPRKRPAEGEVLEGRKTAQGWVVELRAR